MYGNFRRPPLLCVFLLGSRPHTEAGASFVHSFYQPVFVIFVMFILVNVFLAIILNCYQEEVNLAESVPTENSIWHDFGLFLLEPFTLRWTSSRKN